MRNEAESKYSHFSQLYMLFSPSVRKTSPRNSFILRLFGERRAVSIRCATSLPMMLYPYFVTTCRMFIFGRSRVRLIVKRGNFFRSQSVYSFTNF